MGTVLRPKRSKTPPCKKRIRPHAIPSADRNRRRAKNATSRRSGPRQAKNAPPSRRKKPSDTRSATMDSNVAASTPSRPAARSKASRRSASSSAPMPGSASTTRTSSARFCRRESLEGRLARVVGAAPRRVRHERLEVRAVIEQRGSTRPGRRPRGRWTPRAAPARGRKPCRGRGTARAGTPCARSSRCTRRGGCRRTPSRPPPWPDRCPEAFPAPQPCRAAALPARPNTSRPPA